MQEENKLIIILNDLIQVNNDRVAGYQRAIEGLADNEEPDLVHLFHAMINDSYDYNEALEKIVGLLEGAPALGTSGAGKLYRAWMDLKSFVTGGDRKAVLESCELGEQAAVRAYEEALEENDLTSEIRSLVQAQKNDLELASEKISALKDIAQ